MKFSDLSMAQKKIILAMYQNGYYLVCNEGANYKCWLENKELKRVNIPVNRTTGNALGNTGWIEPTPRNLTKFAYYYLVLTKQAIKAIEASNPNLPKL